MACEPLLLQGIHERAWFNPGRARRPKSNPRVLQQAPGIPLAAVSDMPLGNRTIDLDATKCHWQMIRRRCQQERLAVKRDMNCCLTHCVAQAVPLFFAPDQFDRGLAAVRELYLSRFVHLQVNGANSRICGVACEECGERRRS